MAFATVWETPITGGLDPRVICRSIHQLETLPG
jgi:hypothetical protein